MMEGRGRRWGVEVSPDKSSKNKQRQHQQRHQQQNKQRNMIPVVYYLCSSRHLDQPHFIQVPISTPDQGLCLRDVVNRLNALRGKGMASMYSWSSKRSYKNGFVWHDLSEDDLILPIQGNEYVLKGSELLNHHQSPSDGLNGTATLSNPKLNNPENSQQQVSISSTHQQQQQQQQEVSSFSSSPASATHIKQFNPHPPHLRVDKLSPNHQPGSSGNVSPNSGYSGSLAGNIISKPVEAQDASTQTEESRASTTHGSSTCAVHGVSTDDVEYKESYHNYTTMQPNEISSRNDDDPTQPSSAPSSSGTQTETLESLIRAEIIKLNNIRIRRDEQDVFVKTTRVRLKAADFLLQLITCGSISEKHHPSFGLNPNYKPSFCHMRISEPMCTSSMVLREVDHLSENPRVTGVTVAGKDCSSGSLVQSKLHEQVRERIPTVRHSCCSEDRSCHSHSSKRDGKTVGYSNSLTRPVVNSSCEQFWNETKMPPISDARYSEAWLDHSKSESICSVKDANTIFTDISSLKGSSTKSESYGEQKEKVIMIEERLTSGARIIIRSKASYKDNEG